jgi:hypothetical protein
MRAAAVHGTTWYALTCRRRHLLRWLAHDLDELGQHEAKQLVVLDI